MSIPDRRDAVAELSEEGLSTRQIGDVLGVDHATAARDAVANATTKSGANAEIESEPVANATRHPDAEDSEDGQAMLEHPAVERERLRQSVHAAAEATAELLVEFEALIESLDGEHRDSAERAAVQAIDTWRRILHHLERPKLRRAW